MKKIICLLKQIINYLRYYSKIFLYYIFNIFPIKNNWVFVDNFNGKGYGDNPKYIVDKMLENESNLKIYCTYNGTNNNIFPHDIIGIKFGSVKHLYILARSKVWIDNVRMPIRVRKRKKQFYIQTWHGGLGFKKIEKDAIDTLSESYIKSAINDSKNIDLLLTNCKWQEDYFKKYFWYDGEIIAEGLPRNDILINKHNYDIIVKNVRERLNIDDNTKIILYAPTFRNNHNFDCYNIDFEELIKLLEIKYSCKWKLLIRLHPNMANYKFEYDNAIDVTNYPNISDLLITSDMLISDYSSIIFDFAILNKPALIYATDIDEYTKERGFAIPLSDVPFPISKNNSELYEIINDFDNSDYLINLNHFFNKNGLNETGHATETVAKIILDYIKK